MNPLNDKPSRRVKTRVILQMEAVECGAAALAIVLAHFRKYVPLEELRHECNVTRDGVKASNMVRAAKRYGLEAVGAKMELSHLSNVKLPAIVFWEFNHFVVFEGTRRGKYFINDPAYGRRTLDASEFSKAFTGVILVFEPTEAFLPAGRPVDLFFILRKWLSKAHKELAFLVLAGLFLFVPGLLLPTFSRIFVDDILIKQTSNWLSPLIVGMALTAIFRAVLAWLQRHSLIRFNESLSNKGASELIFHILRLPARFFFQRTAGDLSSRVSLGQQMMSSLAHNVSHSLLNLLLVVLFGALLLFYNATLSLIVFASCAFNVALIFGFSEKFRATSVVTQQLRGKLYGQLTASLGMIETIKAQGSEGALLTRTAEYQTRSVNAEQKQLVLRSWSNYFMDINAGLTNAAVLGLGAYQVIEGEMSIGMLVAFQTIMSSFLSPVGQLVRFGSELQELIATTSRIEDVLRYPLDRYASSDRLPPDGPETAKLQRLELREVSFGYCLDGPPLLQGIDLSLAPGRRLAIVGATGSGKSTLAKLVCGHFDPWGGEILFDGKPREKISSACFAQSVSAVDQTICLFEGTIKENVTLWDTTVDDVDVYRACNDACIHDAVALRPGAYHYLIEENGRNFSGGERQRLEIARGLATNPSILVLDEGTSALDPVTEKQIYENIKSRGCACLIIAHRLSAIRDCDEIVVLEDGKVIDRGSHLELMERCGYYQRLISAE
jgi:NHLM bacteriocin system ABC transporter peptidase/ATP-binding protein